MIQLKNEVIRQYQEWKTIFWISIAFNILAYLGYIVHFTYAVDDYGFSEVNHIEHGRWLAGFIFNVLQQKSLMPTLSPIVSILCHVLTGIGLCKLINSKKMLVNLLIVMFWSLHPYQLGTYNFRIATVNCAVVYLLSIATLLLVPKGKMGATASVILFYLSLSLYQAALGFAISAIMVQLLLIAFRENFNAGSVRECLRLSARYAGVLIVSVIVYLILTKLIFILFDVPVNSRIQEGFISNLDQLKAKIAVVGTVLLVRLGPIREYVVPLTGKSAIFAIYLLGCVSVLVKKPRTGRRLWGLLWIGLIPLGAVCFILPLAALAMPWRICLGLVVFFAGMFALTQESESLMIRRAGMFLGGFLVICFVFNNNIVFYEQYLTNRKDEFMGNRIIAKIQSLQGYQPGMNLAIVGTMKTESFSRKGKNSAEIITEYIKHTSERRYSLSKSAFEEDWSQYAFLLNYMDLELKRCGDKALEKARAAAKGRKAWPDPDSVFIDEGMVVVVLSTVED